MRTLLGLLYTSTKQLVFPTNCLRTAQEMLRQLWAAAYPREPCDSLKTERWKDMGWQVCAHCFVARQCCCPQLIFARPHLAKCQKPTSGRGMA